MQTPEQPFVDVSIATYRLDRGLSALTGSDADDIRAIEPSLTLLSPH